MTRRPNRTAGVARRGHARRLSLEMLEVRELLTGFTVTSAADNGNNTSPTPGSLRAAIIAADSDNTVGADTISFAIPGGGVQTIAVPTSLPAITRTVVINGDTQHDITPGNTPLVVIDGSNAGAGASGLTFSGGAGSVVVGLSIVGFSTNNGAGGAAIDLQGAAGNELIEGDYIGVGADGSTAKANFYGIVVASPNNTIGGSLATARNVISGNTNAGVFVVGANATGNTVGGNFIGTDASGSNPVGNLFGVVLAASGNTVGGTVAGAANVISGNLGPTGQTGIGVLFEGPATVDVVEGNRIGTDPAGLVAVPNVYGVYFGTPGGSPGDNIGQVTIGGIVAGAGNLISGNFIGITGNTATTLIAGNVIGLDATGARALPGSGIFPGTNGNGSGGILLGATGSTIGGSTAAARNVISGNTTIGASSAGFDLTGDADVIQGNYIGLTTAGVGASGTGNVVGLKLNVTNSTIGGTSAGAGNVIAGNLGDAIALTGNGGVSILGNVIGQNASGGALANAGNGINLTIAAPGSTPSGPLGLNDSIGGTAIGAGNTIANSGGAGIVVHDSDPAGITGLGIRQNRIFGNAKLGIDLNGTGVPIPSTLFVTATGVIGGLLNVVGVYYGRPSTSYAIDLFANGADPSGFGQGPVFLGSQTVTTNSSGFALFNPAFTPPVTPYTSFSATATGPDGNTSGFSANFPASTTGVRADLAVTTQVSSPPIIVGNSVTLTETVTNNGPNPAVGVILTDSLPVSLVNAQVAPSVGTANLDNNNVLTAILGTLAVGQSASVTITATASNQGPLIDAPGASSTTFDANYGNNQAVQTINVLPASAGPNADLAITEVASPGLATLGGNLTYVVTVTNNGPAPSTNATVNDFLPAGVSLVSVDRSQGSQPTLNGTLLTANLGTIAAGASATLTILVKATAVGPITNAANVSGNQFDPISANNSTSLITTVQGAINLVLTQSVPSPTGTVGQFQFFTLTLTNLGPSAATNATLIDSLPANVTFVNAVPSQGGFASLANGVLVDNFGTIAAGASARLTLVVTPKVPGLLVNFAGAYSPDFPASAPAFANASISIITGPSVVGVAGFGKNSELVITFDEALNAGTATNKANYQLVALGKAGKGPNKTIGIASISYNSVAHSVMITPTQALDPTQFYQLVVIGSTKNGVADLQGRHLVNPQYSTPGANFSTVFFAGTLPQI
jgi:uncharacterized repeat protein (TIGR01451 family)